jgi:DDE domain
MPDTKLVEQDHRRIERRTQPMLGFESFGTARRTLAGVEAMSMLTKGQVRAAPVNDIAAQRAFLHQVFGLAARSKERGSEFAYRQSTQRSRVKRSPSSHLK